MTQYYYLASSLPELSLDGDFHIHPFSVFQEFVCEELTPSDYGEMRKCFLFNDVRNLTSVLRENNSATPSGVETTFLAPSYFERDELKEGLIDPEKLFPFMADFVWDVRAEKRLIPAQSLENELLSRMMQSVRENDDSVFNGFSGDYLVFEMRLRNLTAALSGRNGGRAYQDDIIRFDYFSERIALSQAPDFGLGGELGEMAVLTDMFGSASSLEIEKRITAVRWAWLDEFVNYRVFSGEAIFAYSIKIADVERWIEISPDEGRKQLDNLLEQLHQDIRKITREENS